MVERCRLPSAGVVAHFAGLRETPSDVVRIRRTLEIFQVAGHARRAGQVVIVIDVAVGALARRNCMRSRQSEIHERVVESRRLPRDSRVALRAVRGEVSRYVIGVRRSLKILQVAADTGGAGQIVVVVNVAIDALSRRNGVSASQRESYRTVIEVRVQPGVGSVADCAVRREAGLRVVGVAGRLEFIQVTRHALG